MSNPIFGLLNGGQNTTNMIGQNASQFDPQMSQQFNSFVQGLDQSIRSAPQNTVQQLINSGRMSSAQFEQFRQMANRLTGKNY